MQCIGDKLHKFDTYDYSCGRSPVLNLHADLEHKLLTRHSCYVCNYIGAVAGAVISVAYYVQCLQLIVLSSSECPVFVINYDD